MRNWLTPILAVFTFIFIFTFTSTFTCLYAIENALFKYRSGNRRDPFVPLVSKEGKLLVQFALISSISDVILEGILYDPRGDSVVVLNSLILKENDQIGGITVVRIEEDRVILSYEDEEYTFKLKE